MDNRVAKRKYDDVTIENEAVNELEGFFKEMRMEAPDKDEKIDELENEFSNLLKIVSNNDDKIVAVTDSIASRVKMRSDRKKIKLSTGGKKQRGGEDFCTPFKKKIIKLLLIAGLLGSLYTSSNIVTSKISSFFDQSINLLSEDIRRSLGGLTVSAKLYIERYIRAAIDSIRISIDVNNSTLWETFLNSINWTNFGKLFAGITAMKKLAPQTVNTVKNACQVGSKKLDDIVDEICKELEQQSKNSTNTIATQTDEQSENEAETDGKNEGRKITDFFNKQCETNTGGKKSRRRSIKKKRKTRRKLSSKKTNKKKRRSKRRTSRR